MAPGEVFIGYASQPMNLADTLRSAARDIGELADVEVKNWEDMRTGGRLLLSAIEEEILRADVSIFDLTQLNENVLFELGFAIGSDQVIWPTRDDSDTSRATDWTNLGLLDSVGQTRFTNSQQLFSAFLNERPDIQGTPFFTTDLAAHLSGGRLPGLFYLAEPQQTDAGTKVQSLLELRATRELPLVIADPREASVQTLAWFAQHLYAAQVVVIHLASRRRQGAAVHNARASLVAGLARGLKKPLLMLAEPDYESALDYRDLFFDYPSADECRTRVAYWLERVLAPADTQIAEAKERARALRLSTELGSVDLGEYVAENEAQALEDYYVETASFREVVAGDSRVYVGARGAGKSATVIRADALLRSDRRNLVCLVKPAGYDLDGLVRLLQGYDERDAKGYVVESLWKYILMTELALAVERDLATRPAGTMPDGPEWELLSFMADNAAWIKVDFASRLERAVDRLLSRPATTKLADQRQQISEALHTGPIRELRAVLAPALAVRRHVYIIADNLDKAWDRGSDIAQLSRLLLGLLTSMDSFRQDLEVAAPGDRVPVSLSLFIRSDIFSSVAALAREPDKLPVRRLRWEDELPLIEILDRRYAVSRDHEPRDGELWEKYFCSSVAGTDTREWILRLCIPRPRDLLYLCRAAIDQAVAQSHVRVEAGDLVNAERQYSLFAFEAAAIEGQARVPDIDNILLEFAGMPTSLTESQLSNVFQIAGVTGADKQSAVTGVLRDVNFLGLRTGDAQTTFTDSPREKQRADVLARRLAEKREDGSILFDIHPAFWAYLEMERTSQVMNLGV